VLVTGILRGREPEEMLDALGAPNARLVVTCPPPSPRALPAAELARAAEALGVGAVATGSVTEALEAARRHSVPEDVILVSGSLYVVGAAREVLTAPGA
jgi:dihydrofolate synthase/folylpolyglutamate synthase